MAIDGVQVAISTEELTGHLAERITFHADRAVFYADEMDRFRKQGVAAQLASDDPVETLARKREEHNKKAAYFAFIVAHLEPNEVYRLREHELHTWEFLA